MNHLGAGGKRHLGGLRALSLSGNLSVGGTLTVTGATALGGALTVTLTGIAATLVAGASLVNGTASTVGTTAQYSPATVLTGSAWKSDATAASQQWDWATQNRPVTGTSVTTSALHWLSQMDAGGYTSRMNLPSAGALTVTGTLGVGAATPGPYLYVKGTADNNSYVRIDSADGSTQFIIGSSDTTGFIGTLSNDSFAVRSNNTDRLAVSAAGAFDFKPDGTNIKFAVNSTGVGFYGVTPVARSTGWTITNDATDRSFDANADSTLELADVVATLIRDLAATGIIGAVA